VRRVETHAESRWLLRTFDHLGQLLERAAQATALPGGDLQASRHLARRLRCRAVNHVERRNNFFNTLSFAGFHVRAGMNHQKWNTKLIAPLDFLDHPIDALSPKLGVCSPPGYQIRTLVYR